MIVTWWVYRWMRRAQVADVVPRGLTRKGALAVWGRLLGCAVAGGLVGAITLIDQPDLPRTLHMTLASGVIGTICGGTLALTAYSLVFRIIRRGQDAPVPGEVLKRAVHEHGEESAATALASGADDGGGNAARCVTTHAVMTPGNPSSRAP